MFVAFGLWNVLLLPFSITVLGATKFQYGLQEGLTSVGFVVGSLFMARYADRLPEPAWIVVSLTGMGIAGIAYALATSVPVAILLVTISGLLQPPSSVSRAVLLQRNTPREMRGRVFSAFYVMRDVIFLIGMAGAGLADIVDIRAADHRRVVPPVRRRPRSRSSRRASASAPGARRPLGCARPPRRRRRRRRSGGRDDGRLRPARRADGRVRAA